MTDKTQKSFDDIQNDYRFFEEHSSERSQCLRVWQPHLQALVQGRGPLQMLDFGCGSGSFTSQLLIHMPSPERLNLALVEPAAGALAEARAASEPILRKSPLAATRLEALPTGLKFDLIVSHHVLYYVDPLLPTLAKLLAHLKPGGRALLVVSGQSSIGQLQGDILQRAGIASPYHSGLTVRQGLEQLAPVEVETFTSQLRMADTAAHRRRILNFLVGEFGPRIDWDYALGAFDPFSSRGDIVMTNQEMNLVVQAAPTAGRARWVRPPCVSRFQSLARRQGAV